MEEYITSLRKLASPCKFGAKLDERIRDQFVLRCQNDKIREELWLKDEPPLEDVILVAKRIEHMMHCVDEISKNNAKGELNDKEDTVCVVKKKLT